VVGVNGSGKTTTWQAAAKLPLKAKVMLAAGDTFRAAAIEQLKSGANAQIAGHRGRARFGLASLAFNALSAARGKARRPPGRYRGPPQNKAELMKELEKVVRVTEKSMPRAHAVLWYLTHGGTNALSQVEAFHRTADVTGLVMTKLDGTRVAASWWRCGEAQAAGHFIGVGEGIDICAIYGAGFRTSDRRIE